MHGNFQSTCVCQGTNACIFNISIPERYMYRGVSVNVGLMAAMKSNHQILGNFELTISVQQLNVHTQTYTHTYIPQVSSITPITDVFYQ